MLLPREYAQIESALEACVLGIVSQCTRSWIRPQYPVCVGGKRYRIDLAIPELRIAIEVDGHIFHEGRAAFGNDKTRQNDLVAAGWKILRFTASQSDEEIRTQLTRLL